MVEIVFEEAGNRFYLAMYGHAGYNPGNDVVCAGVSAIIYALAGYIANAEGLKVNSDKYEPGEAEFDVEGDARQAFEMAYIGLAQISQEYPDNVQVTNFSQS